MEKRTFRFSRRLRMSSILLARSAGARPVKKMLNRAAVTSFFAVVFMVQISMLDAHSDENPESRIEHIGK
jgi:hypothetical protein